LRPICLIFQARSKLRHHSAAIQVPIGLEDDFKGLIDLVKLKAYYFHGPNGSVFKILHYIFRRLRLLCHISSAYSRVAYCSDKIDIEEVPSDMEALVAEKRHELIETVSEVDDILAEAFLSDETISDADLEVSR
jgi:elongation factor G